MDVLRTVWGQDPASHSGVHARFSGVRSFPKPVGGTIPLVCGGNSASALERVARHGDGWYGFNVALGELARHLSLLEERCTHHKRTVASLHVAVAVPDAAPDDVEQIAGLGVDELVLVEGPPGDPPRPRPGWRTWRRAGE